MTTDIDLDAIRAREQAATPEQMRRWFDQMLPVSVDAALATYVTAVQQARADIPALIAAVQRRDDALAAVLALHYETATFTAKSLCAECRIPGEWPCPTTAAITAHLAPADSPTTED